MFCKFLSVLLIIVLANAVYCQESYYVTNYKLHLSKARKPSRTKQVPMTRRLSFYLEDGSRIKGYYRIDDNANLFVKDKLIDLTEVEKIRIGYDRRLWLGPVLAAGSIGLVILATVLIAPAETYALDALYFLCEGAILTGLAGFFYIVSGVFRPLRTYDTDHWVLWIIESPPALLKIHEDKG